MGKGRVGRTDLEGQPKGARKGGMTGCWAAGSSEEKEVNQPSMRGEATGNMTVVSETQSVSSCCIRSFDPSEVRSLLITLPSYWAHLTSTRSHTILLANVLTKQCFALEQRDAPT